MKKLSLALAILVAISFSATAFAALTELSDDEMREVDGQIIGGGISDELASELIVKFAAGDEKAILLIKETNRMVNDARNGRITESNFFNYYFTHLRNLVDFGFNTDLILRQADAILRAQEQARQQAQLDQFRRELFREFMGQLTNFANSARNGNPDYGILIDLNKLIGTIPVIEL